MITSYKPNSTSVIEDLFGLCVHSDEIDCYCPTCKTHPKSIDYDRYQDLEDGITISDGIHGGYYIQKLLHFIVNYSDGLVFNKRGDAWHGYCMSIDNRIYYHTGAKHTFGYQVCWLAEILYRHLKSRYSISDEDVRRFINEKWNG